jgi:ABC-type multidrug transport system fused ATPase/permease subunit
MKRLRQILSFLRPFWKPLLLAAVFTGLLTVVGMYAPLLMRRLVNDVARQGNWGIFRLIIGLMLAVPLLRAVLNVGNSISLNRVSLGLIQKTRRRMFRHLMGLSMRFYGEVPVGSINQRLMGDVANISGVVSGSLIGLLADLVSLVFAVVVMVKLSPRLSLLTFALLPAYLLNYWFFSRRIKRATTLLRSNMDHISSTLQERLSAHELIQSYGQDKAEATHFSSQAKQVMDAAIRGQTYNASFNQLSAFINKLGNTAIYCAGCYCFIQETMGYGDVIAFCAYATNILGPVTRFAGVANQIVQAGVSIDRVNEVLDREPAIKETPEPLPVERLDGEIHLEGVTFDYSTAARALENVHLNIPAGTHVAVVGPPGAGRTTLAMLLRRFYDPDEGSIRVDGTDIRHYRLRDYRQAMAMVLPESTIFDGTIRENLCYGNPEVPEDRMVEVARALELHDFVEELVVGYDTRVGTGGLKLSTGVQQKIGIARALLAEPLVLIVDEATVSLDPESAERVNDAIRRAMHSRTCIIIVHRLLMARDSGQVVVMDSGRVVETGEHEELLADSRGLYRELFARQYGEYRLPPAGEA